MLSYMVLCAVGAFICFLQLHESLALQYFCSGSAFVLKMLFAVQTPLNQVAN